MADSARVTYEKGKLYDLAIVDVQPDPRRNQKTNRQTKTGGSGFDSFG